MKQGRAFAHRLPVSAGIRQRGMVTVVVMLFLIATVVFVLAQMLTTGAADLADTQRQNDSTRAFFLAESGLERGRYEVLKYPTLTDTVCGGLASTVNPLGGGNFSVSGTPSVTPCGGSGQPTCSCALTSTGTLGQTARTLKESVSLSVVDGTTCVVPKNPSNGQPIDSTVCNNATKTWWLDLKNPFPQPAIGVFSLAVSKQGAQTGAACSNASCRLAWNNSKMTGADAVQSMGNVVDIPAGTSYEIYQTGATDNLAEVGMLFRGTSASPSMTGRQYDTGATGTVTVKIGAGFWDGGANNSTLSKKPAALTGETNDGTAVDSATEICDNPASATSQTCKSWCYGGDTLVMGFAAQATALTDDIASVTFNTGTANGNVPQNIPMTPFVTDRKYPTATSPNSPPTDIYTSMWYVQNPDYMSAADVFSGARATARTQGVTFTGSINKSSTLLTVTAISGGTLAVGDIITGNIDKNTQICAIVSGSGGIGTYTVSGNSNCSPAQKQAKDNSGAMSVDKVSTDLLVSAVSSGSLAAGDRIFGTGVSAGTKITGQSSGTAGGSGVYTIDIAQSFSGTTISTDSPDITSASGTVIPAVGTIVAIKAGSGVFATGITRVDAALTPTAKSFRLSQRPTTPLSGATLCGGTCAMFAKASGAKTQFTVSKTPTGPSWSAGFVCLKGVTAVERVTKSSISSRRWTEVVN